MVHCRVLPNLWPQHDIFAHFRIHGVLECSAGPSQLLLPGIAGILELLIFSRGRNEMKTAVGRVAKWLLLGNTCCKCHFIPDRSLPPKAFVGLSNAEQHVEIITLDQNNHHRDTRQQFQREKPFQTSMEEKSSRQKMKSFKKKQSHTSIRGCVV